MVLAGLLKDPTEAQRHIHAAWTAAEEFAHDLQIHDQRFGPANTAANVVATEGELGRPRDVIRLAEELFRNDTGLPPTRLVDVHTNTARAQLDLGDRDGAQTSLLKARDIAPPESEGPPNEPRSAAGPDLATPAQQPPTCQTS